ncbi:hypothetical protein [Solemya pervernicosa gill symbiont]|nr:hypothetical protein [Solemya pervernicosa gill symbiont]
MANLIAGFFLLILLVAFGDELLFWMVVLLAFLGSLFGDDP